jgi:hypothetical protein
MNEAVDDGKTMAQFEVRFTVEVRASSPEQAASIARDMLLDPDTQLHGDVHAFEYYEPAEAWFPCEDHGVSVYFGDRRSMAYIYGGNIKPYAGAGVRPVECVAWERVR